MARSQSTTAGLRTMVLRKSKVGLPCDRSEAQTTAVFARRSSSRCFAGH